MPSRNTTQRLTDILDKIAAIRRFVTGMSFEAYLWDQKTVYAVTRALEIISEASRRLPEAMKRRHPGAPAPDGPKGGGGQDHRRMARPADVGYVGRDYRGAPPLVQSIGPQSIGL